MKLVPCIRALLREHDGWHNCDAQEPVEEEEYEEEESDDEDDPDISTLEKEVGLVYADVLLLLCLLHVLALVGCQTFTCTLYLCVCFLFG